MRIATLIIKPKSTETTNSIALRNGESKIELTKCNIKNTVLCFGGIGIVPDVNILINLKYGYVNYDIGDYSSISIKCEKTKKKQIIKAIIQ